MEGGSVPKAPGADHSVVSVGQMVRCATVDNFQGEEAKVILLSLTRNNAQGNIGWFSLTSWL